MSRGWEPFLLPYNRRIRREAERQAAEADERYANTTNLTVDPSGAWVGHAAEIGLGEWLTERGIPFRSYGNQSRVHDYDIAGLRFELKTRRITTSPAVDWSVHAQVSQSQRIGCDYYIFAMLDEPHGKLWLCGVATREEFVARAEILQVGDPFPHGNLVRGAPVYLVYGLDWLYRPRAFFQAMKDMS